MLSDKEIKNLELAINNFPNISVSINLDNELLYNPKYHYLYLQLKHYFAYGDEKYYLIIDDHKIELKDFDSWYNLRSFW